MLQLIGVLTWYDVGMHVPSEYIKKGQTVMRNSIHAWVCWAVIAFTFSSIQMLFENMQKCFQSC